MLSELPKLFDRNFVTAFFLPAMIFVIGNLILGSSFGLIPSSFFKSQAEVYTVAGVLSPTIVVGIAAWLVGIVLVALNYEIYRIAEGYGSLNPAKLLLPIQRRRHKRVQDLLNTVNDRTRMYPDPRQVPAELVAQRGRLTRLFAEEFPVQASKILPTALGNIIKAFEDYSFYMYGLDTIAGWGRLAAVVNKDFRELLDEAKSLTDFWLNLATVLFILMLECVTLWLVKWQLRSWWIFLVAGFLAPICWSRVKEAAKGWGDVTKSAFDVFLPDLRKRLEFPQPKTNAEEQALWRSFSQAITYRESRLLPNRIAAKETEE